MRQMMKILWRRMNINPIESMNPIQNMSSIKGVKTMGYDLAEVYHRRLLVCGGELLARG